MLYLFISSSKYVYSSPYLSLHEMQVRMGVLLPIHHHMDLTTLPLMEATTPHHHHLPTVVPHHTSQLLQPHQLQPTTLHQAQAVAPQLL